LNLTNKKRLILTVIFLLLTALCIAFIFSNSLKTADASAEQSASVQGLANSVLEFLGINGEFSHKLVRKAAHIAEFALLGALASVDFWLILGLKLSDGIKKSLKLLSPALPCAILIAAIDELLQLSASGRSAQISDALIDTLGSALGVLTVWLVFLICRFKKSRKERKES